MNIVKMTFMAACIAATIVSCNTKKEETPAQSGIEVKTNDADVKVGTDAVNITTNTGADSNDTKDAASDETKKGTIVVKNTDSDSVSINKNGINVKGAGSEVKIDKGNIKVKSKDGKSDVEINGNKIKAGGVEIKY